MTDLLHPFYVFLFGAMFGVILMTLAAMWAVRSAYDSLLV